MKKTLTLMLSMLLVLALCVGAGAEELPWTIKESTGLIKLASGTNVAGTVTIPAEVLKYPLRRLAVGVLGLGEGGKVVIPTIRALGPEIRPGVEPSGDPGTDPELPVWQQILTLLGDLEDLLTNNRDTLVEAINEALSKASDAKRMYFIPHVSAEGILSWSNYGNLPNPHPANIRGPAGADGKSAYRYAQEGGYEGTEGEFVEKMAAIALGQLMLKDAVTGKDYKLYVENGNLRMREGEGYQCR